MSTQFRLHSDGIKDLELDERSAKYDLDFSTNAGFRTLFNALTPEEVLKIASRMIYAVWCSYPDEADACVRELVDDIPRWQAVLNHFNRLHKDERE